MKGKKLTAEEEEEEPEADLEAGQEAELDLEAQLESEPQELSPRGEDKKKVGQEDGLSALAFDQSILQAETPTCEETGARQGGEPWSKMLLASNDKRHENPYTASPYRLPYTDIWQWLSNFFVL